MPLSHTRQEVIRAIHTHGVSSMTAIPHGVPVLPVPLFAALDGRSSGDYIARVEPSAQGGAKMARLLLDALAVEEGSHARGLGS
jgi:hypothetical protein